MPIVDRPITLLALLLPLLPALLVIVVLSAIPEPRRLRFSAISAAGFTGLYLNGGFGAWEFAYLWVASIPAYYAQRSYTAVGIAWLMHGLWDLAHHFYGNTIWHWDATSSLGCAVMDPVVAVWFFMGAPSIFAWRARHTTALAEQA